MSNTQIKAETVAKIASLAKLDLDSAEIDTFTPQLNQIFSYINQLEEVETAGVPPTAQINDQLTVLRDDIIDEARALTAQQATSQSSHTSENYFVVDAVIASS